MAYIQIAEGAINSEIKQQSQSICLFVKMWLSGSFSIILHHCLLGIMYIVMPPPHTHTHTVSVARLAEDPAPHSSHRIQVSTFFETSRKLPITCDAMPLPRPSQNASKAAVNAGCMVWLSITVLPVISGTYLITQWSCWRGGGYHQKYVVNAFTV